MRIEQQNPDFCYTEEEKRNYIRNSFNPRYSYFRQNYFTTGDLEQFLERWGNYPRDENRNQTLFQKFEKCEIQFKNELCIHDYFNTFQYTNEKFKKGCFLQFHENELKTYIPFSKQNFKNEWGSNVQIDPKFGTINNMMRYLSEFDKDISF